MKKRILAYLAYIDELLENDNAKNIVDSGTDSGNEENNDCDIDWNIEMKKHLVQISFFAHERLVHLIVTVLLLIVSSSIVIQNGVPITSCLRYLLPILPASS